MSFAFWLLCSALLWHARLALETNEKNRAPACECRAHRAHTHKITVNQLGASRNERWIFFSLLCHVPALGCPRPCQYSHRYTFAYARIERSLSFGFYLSRKCRRDLWAFVFVCVPSESIRSPNSNINSNARRAVLLSVQIQIRAFEIPSGSCLLWANALCSGRGRNTKSENFRRISTSECVRVCAWWDLWAN